MWTTTGFAEKMGTNIMGLCVPSTYRFCSSKAASLGSASNNFNGRNPIRISIPTRVCNYRPLKTVMMAKRELELKEIREKTNEEINEEIIDLKGELQWLRLKKGARKEFKSSEFRRMRKRVARMLTVRRERELEQGINKRQSRKMDRAWKRSIVVRPPPSLRKLLEEKAAKAAKTES